YDLQVMLPTYLSMLRAAQDFTYRLEPLATLGDSLALCHQLGSASALDSGKFEIGAYEMESLLLIEGDAQGQPGRSEVFAAHRLDDAIVRLYERYAELLPAGPARDRATATARSVAVLLGPIDIDRWATAFAPGIEFVDNRTVGLGSVHGVEALLRSSRAMLELLEDVAGRVDDILDLRSDALLFRWTS